MKFLQYLKAAASQRNWLETIIFSAPAVGFVYFTHSSVGSISQESICYVPMMLLAISGPTWLALRILSQAMIMRMRDQYRIFQNQLRMRG